ncbi:hypothetical protein J0H58_32825, partial [bacterium]|nr:hypothetical protein [bacterium]
SPAAAAAALRPWGAPGPAFPVRLFRPAAADMPGPPTEGGYDPSPTPPPPTRRIVRPSVPRRGLSPATPVVLEPTPPPAGRPKVDEAGGTTVRLHPAVPPPPVSPPAGWWAAATRWLARWRR